jgi:hypothetical protein
MNSTAPPIDFKISPIELVDSLDVEAIRAALDELDKQEVALRHLLRVALARQRGTVGRPGKKTPHRPEHEEAQNA